MIDVDVFKSYQGITAFEISGHAGSGPYGYDLVCAGVSAISFGTVNALIEIGGIELEIEQGSDGGYLYVKIPSESVNNRTIQTILKAMVVSLTTIENENHTFIQINKN